MCPARRRSGRTSNTTNNITTDSGAMFSVVVDANGSGSGTKDSRTTFVRGGVVKYAHIFERLPVRQKLRCQYHVITTKPEPA